MWDSDYSAEGQVVIDSISIFTNACQMYGIEKSRDLKCIKISVSRTSKLGLQIYEVVGSGYDGIVSCMKIELFLHIKVLRVS